MKSLSEKFWGRVEARCGGIGLLVGDLFLAHSGENTSTFIRFDDGISAALKKASLPCRDSVPSFLVNFYLIKCMDATSAVSKG